jgi:hypothetical protein
MDRSRSWLPVLGTTSKFGCPAPQPVDELAVAEAVSQGELR